LTVIDQNQGNPARFKLDVLWLDRMRGMAVVAGPSRIVRFLIKSTANR